MHSRSHIYTFLGHLLANWIRYRHFQCFQIHDHLPRQKLIEQGCHCFLFINKVQNCFRWASTSTLHGFVLSVSLVLALYYRIDLADRNSNFLASWRWLKSKKFLTFPSFDQLGLVVFVQLQHRWLQRATQSRDWAWRYSPRDNIGRWQQTRLRNPTRSHAFNMWLVLWTDKIPTVKPNGQATQTY